MPELPEIALYQKYLRQTSLNKKVRQITFHHSGSLQAPRQDFEKFLIGEEFTGVGRLGKYLYLETSGDRDLVMHFGMSGKPEFFTNREEPKYSRVVFSFTGDEHLAYVCRRKLGKLYLSESLPAFREEHQLGEDALGLEEKEFTEILERSRAGIKSLLMDQHQLSGIGNVYSDEMLFQAKIHPSTRTTDISPSRRRSLFQKMREILETAIELDGNRDDFPKNWIIHCRNEDAACPGCSGKIKMAKIAGRSTYFCPSCQKEV